MAPDKPASTLDDIDREILRLLVADGRITWARLASAVGLTPPATADRVRRLQSAGVVRGFTALVDPESVGKPLLAFTWISVGPPWNHDAFVDWADATDAVQEFHTVAGDFDYLIKIRCESPDALEEFLRTEVRNVPGIRRTSTTIVLSSPKETLRPPLA
jgi:Lrp/AsnC family leucine-responsive transcriptional regulator